MIVSADYICPARGLATLDPPDPQRIRKGARSARDLGVDRLYFPVLEESLLGSVRSTVKFLDGLVLALDGVAQAGLTAGLIAPASKLMGVRWAPPYLVKGYRDPRAQTIFVDGALRGLHFLDWWADPPLVSKRIKLFRELLSAVAGHPGLREWVLLDRAFEAVRPDPEAAEFVLRSYIAEVRERDESAGVLLGLGWSDLMIPQPALNLSPLVDGIRMAGGKSGIPGLPEIAHLADELILCSFVAAMGLWLFEKPQEVQVGWGLTRGTGDPDAVTEGILHLAARGLSGLNWLTLVDPEPGLRKTVPWSSQPGLESSGLFYPGLEPKQGAEEWLRAAHRTEKGRAGDFIDIGRDEYLDNPGMHIRRLWDHYRESR
jgi:hypothetical protein